jgi:POT family proton-dependent oligopeptide transporter
MQTLLVLYMVEQLLLPGHVENILGFGAFRGWLERLYGPLSEQALASAIFGLFTGGVYLTPILGGLLADRWLGRTRTIIFGGVSVALGQCLILFEAPFLAALICLALGVGCFKGNIASQVGGLYGATDSRRASGYQWLFFGMCSAVIVTQLICGALAEWFGWRWGFFAAGVGMLIGLAVYLGGRHHLPADDRRVRGAATASSSRFTSQEWRSLLALLIILLLLMVGLIGNQQYYNAFLVWAKDSVDLSLLGRDVPVTWLASFDSIMAIIMALVSVQFWRWLTRFGIEPDEVTKLTIGVTLQALAMLTLWAALQVTPEHQRVGLGWMVLYEILLGGGGANIIPIILALVARAAPRQINATMISSSYLIFFGANMLVGWLGGYLRRMDAGDFWLLHFGLIQLSALMIFGVGRGFRSVLVRS